MSKVEKIIDEINAQQVIYDLRKTYDFHNKKLNRFFITKNKRNEHRIYREAIWFAIYKLDNNIYENPEIKIAE